MQDLDGQTVYSATDLVGFLECEHLTELERAALGGLVVRPVRDDPELVILQERGMEHETRFMEYLRQQGRTVEDGRTTLEIADPSRRRERIEADAARTRRLMADGADVIYQATLFDGIWLGYVDFLVRVDQPSSLGAHAYEVFDTKLARRTKGGALIQMCVYSELVARLQGHLPERMHVALGGSGHRVESHRLDDYLAYFRSVRSRFLAAVTDTPARYPLSSVPDPVSHCDVCRWEAHCAVLRRDADHLSGVAGLRTDQARRLVAAGVETLTALATLADPLPTIDGIADQALASLHAQARLQHTSRGLAVPRYELLPVQAGLGLAALPEPHPADLFFDIEGDPFAEEDGLEYLFGIWDPMTPEQDGTPGFRAWWAHSREQEKTAFEGFVDFVMDRWRRYPGMHVYHYAAYERGRMGMLSTRHATREGEIDDMLRRGLFVDLFKVVRQGVRVGTASYSIKKLEPLYALARVIALKDAGSSIVRYEEYIRSVDRGPPRPGDPPGDCRVQPRRLPIEPGAPRLARGAAGRGGRRIGGAGPRPGPPEDSEKPPSPRDARIRDLVERLSRPCRSSRSVGARAPLSRPPGSSRTCSNGTGGRRRSNGGPSSIAAAAPMQSSPTTPRPSASSFG